MALQLVHLNGSQQGVIIKHNKDKFAPILLFLHGGPGFPAYPLISANRVELEQEFTVCYWISAVQDPPTKQQRVEIRLLWNNCLLIR